MVVGREWGARIGGRTFGVRNFGGGIVSGSGDYVTAGPSIAGSIWRYRFVVLAGAVLFGATGYMLSMQQPAVYVTSTTLTMRDPAAPGVFSSVAGGVDIARLVQQQADFMTTRTVLEPAAKQLEATVEELEDAIEVYANPEVGQITVTASGPDGDVAAMRANTIVDSYESIARDHSRAEIEAANSVFQTQINQLLQEQRDLQRDLEGVDVADRDPLIESRLQALGSQIAAMQTQTAEVAAKGAVYGSGIQSIEEGLPPASPASPQPERYAAVAAALGFGLASAFAYWRGRRSRRIETRVDAAAVLNVPLLGEIPSFRRSGPLTGGDLVLGGEASEAFEFVLSSIEFGLADLGGSSILVTSASAGDGKTVTALHVAIAAARESRRITLVDTDIRAHGLTSLLRAEQRPGVVQLAAGEVTLHDCIRPYRLSDTAQLNMVPAGPAPASSIGLMRAPEFKRAIQDIRRNSELVVLDSAPLLAVADATVIAAQVDAIVLVVDSRTSVDQLQKMQERLTFVSTPLLGYVYNRSDTSRPARYGYGYGANGQGRSGQRRRATESVSASSGS
jgi:capsular exopolysaccharide synthesis family protein